MDWSAASQAARDAACDNMEAVPDAAAHAPGPPFPAAAADHFTVIEILRRPDGALPRVAAELSRR